MFPEWEQVFLGAIKPVGRDFFAGKVGIDGGCGFGRSLHYYRRDEIAAWYRDGGFDHVRIDPEWNGRALGHVPIEGPPAA